jgi:transcriptional regulator with XRE-family HTH domain
MEPKIIKILMIAHDISQTEIAKELKMSKVSVYQAITGISRCYQVEEYIAKRVGVSQESLFGKPNRRQKRIFGPGSKKRLNSKFKSKAIIT